MKFGHSALQCYHRFNHSYNSDNLSQLNALFATSATIQDPSWYVDSGASNLLTTAMNNLSLQNKYHAPDQVTVGNGESLPIHHIGQLFLSFCYSRPVKLNCVLHVPHISKNLISVSKLTSDNMLLLNSLALIVLLKDLKGECDKGILDKGLYKFSPKMSFPDPSLTKSFSMVLIRERTSIDVWRNCLGHPSECIV